MGNYTNRVYLKDVTVVKGEDALNILKTVNSEKRNGSRGLRYIANDQTVVFTSSNIGDVAQVAYKNGWEHSCNATRLTKGAEVIIMPSKTAMGKCNNNEEFIAIVGTAISEMVKVDGDTDWVSLISS